MVIQKYEVENNFKLITAGITLSLTIIGVVISLFNYIILNKLQPINFRLDKIDAANTQTKEDLSSYKEDQSKKLDTLATKDQIAGISSQLNSVDGNVKLLLSKLK